MAVDRGTCIVLTTLWIALTATGGGLVGYWYRTGWVCDAYGECFNRFTTTFYIGVACLGLGGAAGLGAFIGWIKYWMAARYSSSKANFTFPGIGASNSQHNLVEPYKLSSTISSEQHQQHQHPYDYAAPTILQCEPRPNTLYSPSSYGAHYHQVDPHRNNHGLVTESQVELVHQATHAVGLDKTRLGHHLHDALRSSQSTPVAHPAYPTQQHQPYMQAQAPPSGYYHA